MICMLEPLLLLGPRKCSCCSCLFDLDIGPASLTPSPQAMGLLFISRPDLMLADPAVMPLLEGALEPCRPAAAAAAAVMTHPPPPLPASSFSDQEAVKRRVLANLVDLLRAEEDGMAERQAQVKERGKWEPGWGCNAHITRDQQVMPNRVGEVGGCMNGPSHMISLSTTPLHLCTSLHSVIPPSLPRR